MTAQTFIFVHDQQIVVDYIRAGKFAELPSVQYVFLGHRPVDLIRDLPGVVIARELKHNIEHLPNLVAWTGWYAVVRNGLVTADIVNLFEYDVNIRGTWQQHAFDKAYFGCQKNEVWYNYNGIRPFVEKIDQSDAGETYEMPMTSNYTIKPVHLDYVIKEILWEAYFLHPQAGHIAERHCSSLLWFLPIDKFSLQHLYADSHGTQGRGDRYEQIKAQLI